MFAPHPQVCGWWESSCGRSHPILLEASVAFIVASIVHPGFLTMDDGIEFSLYTFSASAPLAEGDDISHLFYTAPVAPGVVDGVSPTITRRFYAE